MGFLASSLRELEFRVIPLNLLGKAVEIRLAAKTLLFKEFPALRGTYLISKTQQFGLA